MVPLLHHSQHTCTMLPCCTPHNIVTKHQQRIVGYGCLISRVPDVAAHKEPAKLQLLHAALQWDVLQSDTCKEATSRLHLQTVESNPQGGLHSTETQPVQLACFE